MAKAVAGDVIVQGGLGCLVVHTRLFRFVVCCKRKQGGFLAELSQLVKAKEKAGLAQTTRSSCASLEGRPETVDHGESVAHVHLSHTHASVSVRVTVGGI